MKEQAYKQALQAIEALIADERDMIAVMSTIACELYHAFDYVNWVGFYRRVDQNTLKVGPYQGSHGCLSIDIERGVCGACVRHGAVQVENDVDRAVDHIACSSETKAEIVVPICDGNGRVSAVLDVDATRAGVFDDCDIRNLTRVCSWVATRCA